MRMKKVLIVEDDAFISKLYERALTANSYLVEVANDGVLALDLLVKSDFDIILLDIMLPKITGIDVLKTIRTPSHRASKTPVFLITNVTQDDIIKDAFQVGADGYLLKSQLTPKDVVVEIDTFLQKKAIPHQNK